MGLTKKQLAVERVRRKLTDAQWRGLEWLIQKEKIRGPGKWIDTTVVCTAATAHALADLGCCTYKANTVLAGTDMGKVRKRVKLVALGRHVWTAGKALPSEQG